VCDDDTEECGFFDDFALLTPEFPRAADIEEIKGSPQERLYILCFYFFVFLA